MKKLILASNNQKKIKELKELLSELPLNVLSLKDMNIDIEVEEDGKTFEENSRKKAEEIYKYLKARGEKNFFVMADDSGLEVDALDGAPGIYSARYSGGHGNDEDNNKKLLKELDGVPEDKRGAQFTCQIALFDENGEYNTVKGIVRGRILEKLNGAGGFGYDPLFFYEPFGKTFAEAGSEEKNKVSHRGKALKEIKKVLENKVD